MTESATPMVLINGETATLTGRVFRPKMQAWVEFQAIVAGTGTVTATIPIYVRINDLMNWILLGTITLSGTTSASDGFTSRPWPQMRMDISAISGTGAAVTGAVGGVAA